MLNADGCVVVRCVCGRDILRIEPAGTIVVCSTKTQTPNTVKHTAVKIPVDCVSCPADRVCFVKSGYGGRGGSACMGVQERMHDSS